MAARFLLVVWLLVSMAQAVRAEPPVTLAPLQDELTAKLYAPTERQADFEDLAGRAAAVFVPAQTIAEARLAFGIRTRTADTRLADAVRELDALITAHQWKRDDSKLFNNDTEARGGLFFGLALLAAKDGNDAEYERCIKEAFWNDPDAGPLLAGELRVHREMTSLLNLKVPLNKPLHNVAGQPVMLHDLVEGKTALLLEFWTDGSQLSKDLMDPIKARAIKLSQFSVETVWINVQNTRGEAEQVRKAKGIERPWLLDVQDRPLSGLLRVGNLPCAVLVDQYGRVRYHGYPVAAALDEALKELGVETTE